MHPRDHARAGYVGAITACALLAACSGTTGPAGPAGSSSTSGTSGSQGSTSGGGTALQASAATALTGTITGVTIHSPPVVQFALVNETGAPVQGLPAADLAFAIAQLVPGQNGSASQWNSYI